jgi:hypothetical protein
LIWSICNFPFISIISKTAFRYLRVFHFYSLLSTVGFRYTTCLSILGTFLNCEKWLLASSYLSVCLSVWQHGTTRLRLYGFSLNLIYECV